jgi:hypothetical protein
MRERAIRFGGKLMLVSSPGSETEIKADFAKDETLDLD